MTEDPLIDEIRRHIEWLERRAIVSFALDPEAARKYQRIANLLSGLSGVKLPKAEKKAKKQKAEQR